LSDFYKQKWFALQFIARDSDFQNLVTPKMRLKLADVRRAPALLVTLTLLSVACVAGFAQKLPRALMITGNGNVPNLKKEYPPWVHEFQNEMVVEILQRTISVEVTEDLSTLHPDHLAQYDLVISNSLFLDPTNEQLQALHDFVSEGKSYLTLHCGILSLLKWELYEPFIGGIFIGGPSSDPGQFKVVTENNEFWGYRYAFRNQARHPVSQAVDDFTISDELYYFQPSVADLEVIARAENHPVMWWHPFRKGKVMSLTLGHDANAKSNPGYQELLLNGVRWLTGAPLFVAKTPKSFSNRTRKYTDFLGLTETMNMNDGAVIVHSVNYISDPALVSITPGPRGSLDMELTGKSSKSRITVVATTKEGFSTSKDFDLTIVDDGSGNIASYYGNSAQCSSAENESGMFDAMNIIDGDTTTRWSSAPSDTAWVVVDLQKSYSISRIILTWEASFASHYEILGSENGDHWRTLHKVTHGDGSIDEIRFPPARARFIKVLATERANKKWGYSLYELKVFQK
jgi:type 1 glutamine amidotransferase